MPANLHMPDWGWWIVLYFFSGGIAGGAYFTAAVVDLLGRPQHRPVARMGYYLAFPLSILCALFLIPDLGRPERFWHMIVYSKTFLPWPKWDSPISVGSYALLIFGVFSFLSFVDALVETGRLPWGRLRQKYYFSTPRRIYAVIGALAGFFLASYTGVMLTSTANPVWANTSLLGGIFAASAASTGMAAVALGLILTRARLPESVTDLRQADNVAMVLELILLIVFIALLGATARPLVSGTPGVLLIGGVFILGLLLPLALRSRLLTRGMEGRVSLAVVEAVLALVGGFLLRMVIVMGGQGLL